jgi:hypothetical protein
MTTRTRTTTDSGGNKKRNGISRTEASAWADRRLAEVCRAMMTRPPGNWRVIRFREFLASRQVAR